VTASTLSTIWDVLEHLKETILMLSREKGYSSEDIKSAMDAMNFNFSKKSIADNIKKEAGDKKRRSKKGKGLAGLHP